MHFQFAVMKQFNIVYLRYNTNALFNYGIVADDLETNI